MNKVTCFKGHELTEEMWGELCPICHPLQKCPKCQHDSFHVIFDGEGSGIDHVGAFECCNCENKIWIGTRITAVQPTPTDRYGEPSV